MRSVESADQAPVQITKKVATTTPQGQVSRLSKGRALGERSTNIVTASSLEGLPLHTATLSLSQEITSRQRTFTRPTSPGYDCKGVGTKSTCSSLNSLEL